MINTRNIFTNGDRVVFVFLFVTYIFPYFFNYLVFENIVTDYKSFRPGIDELQYILSVICIYILLSFFFKSFKFNKEVDFRNAFVIILSSLIRYRLILLLVLILIDILGINMLWNERYERRILHHIQNNNYNKISQ